MPSLMSRATRRSVYRQTSIFPEALESRTLFDATVAEAPDFTVNLGGSTGASSVSFIDADGTAATISLKGPGSMSVTFDGAGLTQSTARGKVAVAGTPTGVRVVDVTGSNATTAVTFAARGGNINVTLAGLTADAALKSISAKPVNLTAAMALAGTVGKLDLGDVTNAIISIGGSASDKPAAITLGNSTATDISSGTPLKSVAGNAFVPGEAKTGSLIALSLDKFTSKGDFGQQLGIAGALKSVAIGGNLSGVITGDTIGSLSVRGNLDGASVGATRAFAAGEKALGKVTVGGSVTSGLISVVGNIGTISAASATLLTVFAGVDTTVIPTPIPDAAEDFASPSTITGITIKGTTANTVIAADTITKAALGTVTTANDGIPHGVSADSIGSLSATIGGTKVALKKVETQADADAQLQGATLGDFKVTVI